MNNRETIDRSNNYWGSPHPEVIEAGWLRSKIWFGLFRLKVLNGTLDIHLALESELAEFLGKKTL